MEEEVAGFVEGDGVRVAEGEGARGSDGGDDGVDEGGIDAVGLLAGETEEDGAVGGVAEAGVGERAVEVDLDTGDWGEAGELVDETKRGAHGADGVGA
jgi:hypothetical protein